MIRMMIDFIDRKVELDRLSLLSGIKSPPFVVIVGRRRVGKTRLIQEFLSQINQSCYFFVEEKKPQVLLNEFSAILGEGKSFIGWDGFLRHVLSSFDVVVIDEFQNFSRVDSSFFSTLQKVLDEGTHSAMLVVVGSYMGMMKKIFEDTRSPLFGRASEIWHLPPLPIKDTLNNIKGTIAERITIYSMFGGYPKYYVILDQYGTWKPEKIIRELIVHKYAPLSMEPYNILLMEFGGEYRTYFSILEAIAIGKVSYVDIANFIGMSTTTLHRYLEDLISFGVIERRFPVTEGPRSRKSRYFISDQFVRFWFRYIFPHRDRIESERYQILNKKILLDLPNFVSWEFEQLVRSMVSDRFTKVGPWWNRRGDEIDLVAFDDTKKLVLFGEIKWTSRKVGWKSVRDLIEKADLVPKPESCNQKYLFVSKSGFSDRCIDQMDQDGIIHWDLKDIESFISGAEMPEI